MKKLLAMLLACSMLMSVASAAVAATVIDGKTDRKIVRQEVGVNTVAEGVSPTTGRVLADVECPDDATGMAVTGKYMPMVVQIDNSEAGVGAREPWGLVYADIIYETTLHRNGATRLTAMFNDVLPTSVGPIRSARLAHVWIAKEWFGGFVHFGRQEYTATNAEEELRNVGILRYVNRFDGTDGAKPWNQYFNSRASLVAVHSQNANVAALATLIPVDHQPYEHTLLFATEPVTDGDSGVAVAVDRECSYSSTLIYDAEENLYKRYTGKINSGLTADGLTLHVDYDLGTPITYNNVIIQYTDVSFRSNDAPIVQMVGSGNADYFMNGQHIAGCWERKDMESRTVFYGPDGNEMPLQPGTTFIAVVDRSEKVSYR